MAQPAYLVAHLRNGICMAYRELRPPTASQTKGIVILIHGFPQTSYQFHHILPLFAARGYSCIAPDYRGAGNSYKSPGGFDKVTMADDIALLLERLGNTKPIHLVGHDIGGMIVFTLAHRHPELVKSVCWGECPLPGTRTYDRDRREPERQVQQFHFIFHCVPDLAEKLIEGRERMYVTHFLKKIVSNGEEFTEAYIDHYVTAYSRPEAMRCALGVYAAFEKDAEALHEHLSVHGRCRIPTLILSREHSRHRPEAEEMGLEVTEADMLEVDIVDGAAHYLAEENPEGFGERVMEFVEKHD